jgi:hypothetical protein
MRDRIIQAGVKQLRDFGYPDCTAENILRVPVYKAFFRKMVEGTRDEAPRSSAIAGACEALLRDLDAPAPESAP